MNKLNFVERIKDPIWGEIPITELELKIIATRVFNRLRDIKQMGVAYLSFPGANHSRYEHSLGVMHAAYMLFQMLGDNLPKELDVYDSERVLRVAALLHDVGHPPFSHVLEEAFRKYPHLLDVRGANGEHAKVLQKITGKSGRYSHEDFTEYLIAHDEEIKLILEEETGYPLSEIAQLAAGRATHKKIAPLNSLIDGDLDADRIDYILRDSHHSGLAQRFDINELRGKLRIDKAGEKYKMYILPDAIPAVTSILLARYNLIKEVHYHQSDRIATQMLIELFKESMEEITDLNERAELIWKMHTEMTTSRLEEAIGRRLKNDTAIVNIVIGKVVIRKGYLQQHRLFYLYSKKSK